MPTKTHDSQRRDLLFTGSEDNKGYKYNVDTGNASVTMTARKSEGGDVIRINSESSKENKNAYFRQKEFLAGLENSIMDATTLIASERISKEDKEALESKLKNTIEDIISLNDLLPDIKAKYENVSKKEETQGQKETIKSSAEAFVTGFLFSEGEDDRILMGEEGRLLIKFLKYIPDEDGNATLDRAEITEAERRAGNIDFGENSLAIKHFKDIENLKKTFEPILLRAAEKILSQVTIDSNPSKVQMDVEQACVREISQILFFLEKSAENDGIISTLTDDYDNRDRRGYVLATYLLNDGEGSFDNKLDPTDRFIDSDILSQEDLNDPDFISDMIDLTGMEKNKVISLLNSLMSPIPPNMLKALDKLHDEDHEVTVLAKKKDSVSEYLKSYDIDFGIKVHFDSIRRSIDELKMIKEREAQKKIEKSKDALVTDLDDLNQEITTWLNSLDDRPVSLEQVVEIKGFMGFGGVQNQDELKKKADFLSKRTTLTEQLAGFDSQIGAYNTQLEEMVRNSASEELSETRFTELVARKKRSIEELKKGDLTNEIKSQIDQIKASSINIELPQWRWIQEDITPSLEMNFANLDLNISFSDDDLDGSYDSFEEKIKEKMDGFTDEVTEATKDFFDLFGGDMRKTKAFMEELGIDKNSLKQMQELVLAYVQGSVSKKSVRAIRGYSNTQKAAFFYAQRKREGSQTINATLDIDVGQKIVKKFESLAV